MHLQQALEQSAHGPFDTPYAMTYLPPPGAAVAVFVGIAKEIPPHSVWQYVVWIMGQGTRYQWDCVNASPALINSEDWEPLYRDHPYRQSLEAHLNAINRRYPPQSDPESRSFPDWFGRENPADRHDDLHYVFGEETERPIVTDGHPFRVEFTPGNGIQIAPGNGVIHPEDIRGIRITPEMHELIHDHIRERELEQLRNIEQQLDELADRAAQADTETIIVDNRDRGDWI